MRITKFETILCSPIWALEKAKLLDFLGPLALRLYLAPIFWMAGMNKFMHMEDTIAWFGNSEWGLGLPFPTVMAYLATFTELTGAVCFALGMGVRFITIPLMITMVVAAVSVHLENGWLAIASQDSEAHQRLQGFLQWLQNNHPGRHDFITELGSLVILNNGVEFSVTYFAMLLSLFFTGAGRFLSIDYWVNRRFECRMEKC